METNNACPYCGETMVLDSINTRVTDEHVSTDGDRIYGTRWTETTLMCVGKNCNTKVIHDEPRPVTFNR